MSPHIHSGTVFLVRANLEAKLFIKRFFSLGGNKHNLDAPAFFQLAVYVFDTFRNERLSDPLPLVFRHDDYICQIDNVTFIPKDTGTTHGFIALATGDDEI